LSKIPNCDPGYSRIGFKEGVAYLAMSIKAAGVLPPALLEDEHFAVLKLLL